MRNVAHSIARPVGLPRLRTTHLRWDRQRWPIRCLQVFLVVMVGLSGAAPATGKPKTWAPPIPPERAAITLAIRTVNAANAKVPAKVMWGRRRLGETPLNLRWPADSGPVDIVVLAPGYVPVHTRLYTFADDRVVVKLVDDEGKKALFGYKREPPAAPAAASGSQGAAGAAPGPQGAAPGPQGAAPGSSTPIPGGTSPPAATPPAAPTAVDPPAAAR